MIKKNGPESHYWRRGHRDGLGCQGGGGVVKQKGQEGGSGA